MKHGWSIFFLIIFVAILVLCAIANLSFPKGELLTTGHWETLANELTEVFVYDRAPSPEDNPIWVKIFQAGDGIYKSIGTVIYVITAIGLIICIVNVTTKDRYMQIGKE